MVTTDTRLAAGTEIDLGHPPAESALLAALGVLPILVGAVACWVVAPGLVIRATIVWAGAILCFLSGVRRGLAFRQPGGPTVGELVTMLVTFVLGLGALLLPFRVAAIGLLLAGFATVAVTDVLASRRREAPAYFAVLRPVQGLCALAGLAVLLVRAMSG